MKETSKRKTGKENQDTGKENSLPGERLSLLTELGRRITSSLDLPTVLQAVVDAACDLTGARYGALLVSDPFGAIQEFITHGMTEKERNSIGEPPQGLGLLGWLANEQGPLRLSDLSRHPQAVGFPANHPPMKTFLGIPVRQGDEVLGNLYLTEKANEKEFTQEDEVLLLLFAAQAAVAIRNAQLHDTVDRERHRLDAILNDAPNGMVYIEKATGQLQANRRAEEMLERSFGPSDNLAHLEAQLLTADGDPIPRGSHPLSRALLGKLVDGEELLIARANGTSLPVVCSASPIHAIYAGKGEVTGAVIRFRDITSMKEAQQHIEELAVERGRLLEEAEHERQRLEALIDTSPVGVFVVEAGSGRVMLVNQEAQRILGLSHETSDHLEFFEQVAVYRRPDGSGYEPEELPLQRALYRGETVRAEEVRIEFPDGHTVPTLINATPVYSTGGQITSAIAAIQDITPLEEIDKLRSEFLGMVSHELKTPLTAIKGSAATVLGSRRPFNAEDTRELFEIIDEQADRLRDLVDNILDMTRIEAGSMSVNAEPMDLREVVDEAIANLTRDGGSQDVHLSLADDIPLVKADRRRVAQVIGNLLGNAAKFSPAASPISIDVAYEDGAVAVHVRDQGRGIPKEKLPNLFRKFSQVHDDAGSRLSGSGLGLAICKGIVEAHGGHIWVDSSGEGHGATFSFTLPVAVEAAALPDTTHRTQLLGRVRRTGERTRILAVDDEPQNLRLLQRSLDEEGYHAVVTGDPSRVMELMDQEEPDLVLLDLMLPGISGLELLQRIREFSGVPVIFLTASSNDEDAVKALRMGADDYVTKPFSPSELLARIEAALRRRALPDTLDVRPPLQVGDMSINFAERRVNVSGQPVTLSATEYKLLYELAIHAGRVLTHDQILHSVWGQDYSGETDLIRSFVRNLRLKLGDDARHPRYIFTEPQVGYRMPRS